MHNYYRGICSALFINVLFITSAVAEEYFQFKSTKSIQEEAGNLSSEPVNVIPQKHFQPQNKVELGKQLFEDTRLSKGNVLSCASCHQISQGGDDGLKTSFTNTGEPDLINAPTIFNSAYNFRQTWSGKFRRLEEQAEGDLQNPRHGNIGWDELLPKLKAIASYRSQFNQIYKSDISKERVLDAIASYERSLITPDSRFDQFLKGNKQAISYDELQGYQLFKQYGCIACHQGVNLGGNVFQKFGLFGNYFKQRGNITKADYGRFNITGKEEDRFVFRVPSLRNVEVTAPYLHDGSVEKLEDVIKVMARYQLGASIGDNDVNKIAGFLKTLTGKYQGKYLSDNRE